MVPTNTLASIAGDVAAGFAITGDFPRTEVFEPRTGPNESKCETKEWLWAQALEIRRASQESNQQDGRRNHEILMCVHEKLWRKWSEMGRGTFQQVTQQLGPRWTPTRRFGIAQGNKTRPRDDFTESLVIRAISCTWKGTVDGGDRTAAVVELWTRVLQLDDVQVAFASCQVLEALSSLELQGRERGAWASASTSRWHVSTALAGKDRDVGVSAIVDPARRAELHSPTLAVGSKVEFNRVETAQMMVKAPFLLGVDHRDDFRSSSPTTSMSLLT